MTYNEDYMQEVYCPLIQQKALKLLRKRSIMIFDRKQEELFK